jgi:hypothetical protein
MEMDHRGFHLSVKIKLASFSKLLIKFSDTRGEANELKFVSPIPATQFQFFSAKVCLFHTIFFFNKSLKK